MKNVKQGNKKSASRKALIAEYKKEPKQMGAYSLLNTVENKCFVGISRDLTARINRFQFQLRVNGELLYKEIQADWNRLGEEAFEFKILEVLPEPKEANYDPTDDLDVLLEIWLEQLKPYAPNGYNRPKETT